MALKTHCKTAAISIRVVPALKERLEKHAKAEGRSLANYVERVLALHSMSADEKDANNDDRNNPLHNP